MRGVNKGTILAVFAIFHVSFSQCFKAVLRSSIPLDKGSNRMFKKNIKKVSNKVLQTICFFQILLLAVLTKIYFQSSTVYFEQKLKKV